MSDDERDIVDIRGQIDTMCRSVVKDKKWKLKHKDNKIDLQHHHRVHSLNAKAR